MKSKRSWMLLIAVVLAVVGVGVALQGCGSSTPATAPTFQYPSINP